MEFCSRMFRLLALLIVLGVAGSLSAQNATGTLQGTVTDPSGATVTDATVIAVTPDGQARTVTTNRTGSYPINGLAPGAYTVTVNASGFSGFAQDDINIAAGQTRTLNVPLSIAVEE